MNKIIHRFLWKKYLLLLGCLFCLSSISFSQLIIDSIKTTPVNCPNNGVITVFAHSSTPPLLYSIVAGPVTEPAQTNNLFSSLPQGNYTIKVTDGAANTLTQNTTIGGTYTPLSLNPILTNPYCTGNSDGQIIGNRTAGTGNGPFTWQLVVPSAITTAPQASDTFNNLPIGNYTIKLTDACSSYTTFNATLTDPNTQYNFTYNGVVIEVIGCDSAWVTSFVQLPTATLRLPLTYKYLTKNGTYIPPPGSTVIDSTQLHTTGIISIGQMVPNISYGDSVKSIIFNTCGDSLTFTSTIYPFTFHPVYSYDGCGNIVSATFYYPPNFSPFFGFRTPAKYSFVDVVTNAVVDSGTLAQDPTHYYGNIQDVITIAPTLPVNKTYTLTVTDGCGKVFTQDYTTPAKSAPVLLDMQPIIPFACLDSTIGNYRIHTLGFSAGALFILTSGPVNFGSTKPKFAYTDMYAYPDTSIIYGGGDQYTFFQFLTAGHYQFKIIDTCGNEIDSAFTITPAQVTTSLQENFTYTKGCLGQNKIYYSISQGTATIRNIATNAVLKTQQYYNTLNTDSIVNVPTGEYELTLNSQQGSYGTVINKTYTSCWTVMDTITIAPYQAPTIATSNYLICKGGTTVELIPDSTNGVPPYQYEIIAGPQTFPIQNSNLFPGVHAGIYQARISDACGNATTAQVTVDTIALPPASAIANSCNSTKLFYGSSIYTTYNWTKPNGNFYTGDTLTVDPITPTDTGIYHIQKIVNINGCIDTFNTDYHLSLIATHLQTIQFCNGTVVHVGTSTYTTPGIYTDTLTNVNAYGCDSIVITSLIAMQKKDTNNVVICKGSSVTVGTNTYTTPGIYEDSVVNTAGCYDLIFTNLSTKQFTDTVTTTICSVDSIVIGSIIHKTAGTYIDTLTSSMGCDSIVVLHLSVTPLHVIIIPLIDTEIICQGESLPFGTTQYPRTGIYQDTVVSGCVGLVLTVNLTINPYKTDSIVRSICPGQSFSVGTHTYNNTGIYSDTLSTTTCDSIVTLSLNVNPIAPITISSNVTVVNKGDTIQLSTVASAPYLWISAAAINDNSIQNPTAIIDNSSWIYLYATAPCTSADSIFITVRSDSTVASPPPTLTPCVGSYIFVPNAFTPNNDGKDDVFKIIAGNIKLQDFQIYNRWGQMVFETADINQSWEGTYQGQRCDTGNYVYWLSYFDCNHTTMPQTIKGNILLIR